MATRVSTILAPVLLLALCYPVLGRPVSVVNVCFQVHLTDAQQSGSLARGIGLVKKHLTQAMLWMTSYQDRVFTSRLRSKTLPAAATSFELTIAMANSNDRFVQLFNRLAVACLVAEELEENERQGSATSHLRRILADIKSELLSALCYAHLLLHLSSRYLSAGSLKRIREIYGHSLTALDQLPQSHREWRYLRDYAVAEALHRVARRSIQDLHLLGIDYNR